MGNLLDIQINLGFTFAGLLVGVLVGLTGMGGGALMTPMLIFLFGFNPVTAVGTDILHGAAFKTVGAWRHLRLGSVHVKLAALLALGSVPASIAGVAAINAVRTQWGADALDIMMKQVLGATLLIIAAILLGKMAMQARRGEESPDADVQIEPSTVIKVVSIGIVCGFIVGLTSVGSGTLVGLLLMLMFPLGARRIVGTDVFNAAVLLWAAGISHLIAGNVDLSVMTSLLLGSIPGVVIGSQLTLRFDDRPLRIAIGTIIALSGVKLLGAPDGLVTVAMCVALAWMGATVVRSFRREEADVLIPTTAAAHRAGRAA